MSCGKYEGALAGYFDATAEHGDGAIARGELSAHLDACTDCREELERYRNLQQLMARAPRADAPKNLATEIRVALAKAREQAARTLTQSISTTFGSRDSPVPSPILRRFLGCS